MGPRCGSVVRRLTFLLCNGERQEVASTSVSTKRVQGKSTKAADTWWGSKTRGVAGEGSSGQFNQDLWEEHGCRWHVYSLYMRVNLVT